MQSTAMAVDEPLVIASRPLNCRFWTVTPSNSHGAHINTIFGRWTRAYVNNMASCALCATTVYGYPTERDMAQNAQMTEEDADSVCVLPPAEMLMPFLLGRCTGVKGGWFLCRQCKKKPTSDRMKMLAPMTHELARSIVSLPIPTVQSYSVVNLTVHFKDQLYAYATGTVRRTPFVDGTVVGRPFGDAWTVAPDWFNAEVLASSPVYLFFKPLCQWSEPPKPLSVIPTQVLSRVANDVAERSRHNREGESVLDQSTPVFGVLVNPYPPAVDFIESSHANALGDMHLAREAVPRSFTTNNDGAVDVRTSLPYRPTLELLNFPFLFPDSEGFFKRVKGFTIRKYMKARFSQLLTPYTLYAPYVVAMFQYLRATQVREGVKWVDLTKSLNEERRTNPGFSEIEFFARQTKIAVPASVVTSPQYFREGLRKLFAYVDCFGMPSLFMTLTCDEFSPARWREVSELEEKLVAINPRFTVNDSPVEISALFYRRVKDFMAECVLSDCSSGHAGIFGAVIHYVIRYEFQLRGSPHCHILLWLGAEDAERVGKEIVAYVPAAYDVSREVYVPPTDPLSRELYELVKMKQTHPCRAPGVGCRAGGHAHRKHCKYGYPHAAHEGETAFNAATLQYVYPRPFVPDSLADDAKSVNETIVPYHPLLLMLWKAHCNLQKVSHSSFSRYLMKYATKGEAITPVEVTSDLAAGLGLELDETELKFISQTFVARPVIACEAAWHLLDLPVLDFDTAVTVVYVNSPASRKKLHTMSRTTFLTSVDHYMGRPVGEQFDTLTFYEFYRRYRVSKQRNKAWLNDESSAQGWPAIGTNSCFVYPAPSNYCVRFTDSSPLTRTNEYFYSVLLRRYPFRNEAELMTGSDDSYLQECYRRALWTDDESLAVLIEPYSTYNLMQSYDIMLLVNSLIDRTTLATAPQGAIDTPPSPPRLAAVGEAIPVQRPPDDEFLWVDTNPLSEEQQHVFDAIVTPNDSGLIAGMHFVGGIPGSGKSHLTKHLIRFFDRENTRTVHLSASTGTAARLLSRRAVTCHSGYGIPVGGWALPALHPNSDMYLKLLASDVFIIDEWSMLTRSVFDIVMGRIAAPVCPEKPTDIVKRKLVVVVGDQYQLPPVCEHHLTNHNYCELCHLSSSVWWTRATHHSLRVSVRQATDPVYLGFLNTLRVTTPSQVQIDRVLSNCYISPQTVLTLLTNHADATVLCGLKTDVNFFNEQALELCLPATLAIAIENYVVTSGPLEPMQKWLDDKRFVTLPFVKVGARVMVLRNLSQTVTNGTRGVVESLGWRNHPVTQIQYVNRVFIRVGAVLVSVTRTIKAVSHNNGIQYQKWTFPLRLCYAMTGTTLLVAPRHVCVLSVPPSPSLSRCSLSFTGHKAQGATLAGVTIIVLRDCFTPALAYVMFSRLPSREHLRVVGSLSPDQCVPMPYISVPGQPFATPSTQARTTRYRNIRFTPLH